MLDRPGLATPAQDPLGEALHFLRMSGAFYCRSELSAPWGMTLPPMPGYLWFHVVTAGRPGSRRARPAPGWSSPVIWHSSPTGRATRCAAIPGFPPRAFSTSSASR